MVVVVVVEGVKDHDVLYERAVAATGTQGGLQITILIQSYSTRLSYPISPCRRAAMTLPPKLTLLTMDFCVAELQMSLQIYNE